MRVVVRPHEASRAAFRDWRRSLGATRAERDCRSQTIWAEFVRRIVTAEGPPPGAVVDTSTRPPTFWCEFPGGGLAQILVRPDRRVSMFTVEREVLVLDLVFSPGPPG